MFPLQMLKKTEEDTKPEWETMKGLQFPLVVCRRRRRQRTALSQQLAFGRKSWRTSQAPRNQTPTFLHDRLVCVVKRARKKTTNDDTFAANVHWLTLAAAAEGQEEEEEEGEEVSSTT